MHFNHCAAYYGNQFNTHRWTTLNGAKALLACYALYKAVSK